MDSEDIGSLRAALAAANNGGTAGGKDMGVGSMSGSQIRLRTNRMFRGNGGASSSVDEQLCDAPYISLGKGSLPDELLGDRWLAINNAACHEANRQCPFRISR